MIFTGCADSQPDITSQPQSINLHILGGDQIDFNGDVMTISNFKDQLGKIENPGNTVVELNVSNDATMGAVTDVQKILRESGTLKINYSS
jgi:biopolymer transport protein ExbD